MLTAISLFTGAGGLDLGFEAAGFRIAASVELDPDARQTIQGNRRHWGLLDQGDIHRLNPLQLLESRQLEPRRIDAVIAGPPCQPFSKSALWSKGSTDRLEDPRAKTFDPLLDIVEAALPRALVIENVKGFGSDNDVRIKIKKRLEEVNRRYGTNYQINMLLLNALDYGVPQRRERTFLVMFRDGNDFPEPPITHMAETAHAQIEGVEAHRTAWDAIGDLADVKEDNADLIPQGRWADLLPSVPEGSNYLHHTSRGRGLPLFGWRTRYWSFLLKIAKNRPSWTLQAEPGPATGPFHWKSRQLSIHEMCRLQTFPDKYAIFGSYRSARRQIGNAVPPALAEAIARQIRNYLDGTRLTGAASLATAKRSDCPEPEPEGVPPPKFCRLVGVYRDHPGKGLGPRAIARREKELAATVRE
jgi:DNA (cytosine-5)-methyltransferase 1